MRQYAGASGKQPDLASQAEAVKSSIENKEGKTH